MATAAEITKTFAAAQIVVETAQAERLALQLQSTGGDIERLIPALAVEDGGDPLTVALRYKAALRRVADPVYFAKSLRTEAADLDARADGMLAEAEQDYILAAARRERQGHDDAPAANILARAEAAKSLAADFAARASEKRIAAYRIEARAQRHDELAGVIVDMFKGFAQAMGADLGGRAA